MKVPLCHYNQMAYWHDCKMAHRSMNMRVRLIIGVNELSGSVVSC